MIIGSKEKNTPTTFSENDANIISNAPQGKLSSYSPGEISNPRSEKYSQAQASSTSFPGSANFGIQGPFNESYTDTGSGNFNVSYSLGNSGANTLPSTPPPVTKKTTPTIAEKISVDSGPSGSGGFGNASLGNFDIKPVKFDKVDLSGGKPNETQALTPKEMRRNQRNVKFLKRRIRKGERKGDDMTSTRQALGNAQAQQAGNFKPGQKFKTPTGTGSYVTPKQNREKNGSVIGNTLKNTFGKKDGGSKVGNALKNTFGKKEDGSKFGNALRNAGKLFKKKTKSSKSFKGGMI
jgi:hypothetical protein